MRLIVSGLAVVFLFFSFGCQKDNEKAEMRSEIDRLNMQLKICRDSKQDIQNKSQKTQAELEEKKEKNIQLQAEVASSEVRSSGTLFISIVVCVGILFINNLIWVIAYRRK